MGVDAVFSVAHPRNPATTRVEEADIILKKICRQAGDEPQYTLAKRGEGSATSARTSPASNPRSQMSKLVQSRLLGSHRSKQERRLQLRGHAVRLRQDPGKPCD